MLRQPETDLLRSHGRLPIAVPPNGNCFWSATLMQSRSEDGSRLPPQLPSEPEILRMVEAGVSSAMYAAHVMASMPGCTGVLAFTPSPESAGRKTRDVTVDFVAQSTSDVVIEFQGNHY
jgi:hypothetical protein